MRVLVTGATGFLGTALVKQLQARGDSVIAIGSKDADLTLAGSLDRFQDTYDRVYHLAAWTQAGDFCLKHPGEQWLINQQINTNVLDWWQRSAPGAKMIAIGTSCSYDPLLPLVEDNYLKGTPIDSLFTYAHTKRMLLVGLMALRRQFGLRYLCVVPSTIYGPGYHTDGRQMHFIFDLIRKILRGQMYGERVILWGDGHQKRELVFIDDFVSALIRLSETQDNDVVNVGSGEERSIRSFASVIGAQVGYDIGQIEFDTAQYTGAKSKCLDITKLNHLLPDRPRTPLEQGIGVTIDWFRNYALPPQRR